MDFNAQRFTHLADLAWIWAAQFLPRLGAAVLILGVGFVAARRLSRAVNASRRTWTPRSIRSWYPWCDRAPVRSSARSSRQSSALEALGEKFTPTQIIRQTPPDSDPSRYLEGREPVHAA